jgi:hypothetical protein
VFPASLVGSVGLELDSGSKQESAYEEAFELVILLGYLVETDVSMRASNGYLSRWNYFGPISASCSSYMET